MATISFTANSSFHQLHTLNSENNNGHLYDATFSPYLNGNEGTIVGRLDERSQKLSPFSSNRRSPLQKVEKKEENGEIGVFGAEKYFNVGESETPRSASSIATSKYLHQRDEPVAVATRKHTLQYGTPSTRSESTSNSQSAFLQIGMRNSLRNKKDKCQAKSVLAGLGFKCSCSGKDSVDAGEISFSKSATYGAVHGKTTTRKLVDIAALDASHSIKLSKPNAELLKINNVYFKKEESYGVGVNSRRNSLTFSPMSSASGKQNHLVKMQAQQDEEEIKPRKSLEVFGSPIQKNRIKSLSFVRRMVLSSRDGVPRTEEIDSNHINDAASDASSDLFEIESIKSKTNPFLARQTSDVASGCVSPTNGYAPSEGSIEWSVATASAAVMSDCEEQMSEVTVRSPIRTAFISNGKTKAPREVQRRRPSMLLGCKSHKSVRVAGDAFVTYEHPRSTPRTNTSQVTRFPSETKLGNYGTKHGPQHHAYATSPLQHSHSPHATKLVYI